MSGKGQCGLSSRLFGDIIKLSSVGQPSFCSESLSLLRHDYLNEKLKASEIRAILLSCYYQKELSGCKIRKQDFYVKPRRFKLCVSIYKTFIKLNYYKTFIKLNYYKTFIKLNHYKTFIKLNHYNYKTFKIFMNQLFDQDSELLKTLIYLYTDDGGPAQIDKCWAVFIAEIISQYF